MATNREGIATRLDDVLAGESVAALGRRYGVSGATISRWRGGTRLPDALVIAQICEDKGVSSDWLLGLPAGGAAPEAFVREAAATYGDQAQRIATLEGENAALRAQVTQLQVDLRAAERALATSLTTNVIEAAKEAVGMMAAKDESAKRRRGA